MIAPNRIYNQYRKPKATQWYDITRQLAQGLADTCEYIRYSYDINNPDITSYELDVLGRIVGVDRSFETEILFTPEQYGSATAQYGGVDVQYGATTGSLSQELSNAIFKLLIKAKIAKNNSDASYDSIVTSLRNILEQETIRVIDNRDMTFSLSFGSELTETERYVLSNFDIIPRPQGVEFLGYTEEPSIVQYGGMGVQYGDSRSQYKPLFTV